MLIGQIPIKDDTIGGWFVHGLRGTGNWAVTEVTSFRWYKDLRGIKEVTDNKAEKVKQAKENLEQDIEVKLAKIRELEPALSKGVDRVKGFAESLSEKIERARAEALQKNEEMDDEQPPDLDEEKERVGSMKSADREVILKNLP